MFSWASVQVDSQFDVVRMVEENDKDIGIWCSNYSILVADSGSMMQVQHHSCIRLFLGAVDHW